MRKELLSTLCRISNGYAFKSNDYVSHGHRVMRITNVQKGLVVDNDPKFVPNEIADKAYNFKLNAGDILVSLTGNVGRVGRILSQHLPAVLNQRVGLIRPTSSEINDNYLFQFLNSDKFEREAIQNSNGVAQLNLSTKWIENYEIPLPPLDDQVRIAYVLGKVEGLIVQRKQHLQQLDDLLKSVFLEMFGPTNPDYETWPLVEIRELAAKHKGAMRTGPFGSNLLHSEFMSEGDVAVLGIDNAVQNRFTWGERRFISKEKYQELQSYRIFPGDVIVTIMGTIGRSAVIPEDIPVAINTKHLAAITLNREVANPLFLSYAIHSSPYVLKQFASKNRGAIMSGLNLGLIKETKIKRSPIDLQNRFAEIHKSVDQLKFHYQKSLSYLENLYGTLSQQAFKGELDLSRVHMPKSSTQRVGAISVGDQASVPEPIVQAVPVINLPTSDKLPVALENAEARKILIGEWLEAYRQQLRNAPFSVQDFMAATSDRLTECLQTVVEDETVANEQKNRLAELYPGNTVELDVNDYEHIKKWVFDALVVGALMQGSNKSGNCIELKAVHS